MSKNSELKSEWSTRNCVCKTGLRLLLCNLHQHFTKICNPIGTLKWGVHGQTLTTVFLIHLIFYIYCDFSLQWTSYLMPIWKQPITSYCLAANLLSPQAATGNTQLQGEHSNETLILPGLQISHKPKWV